MANRNGESNPMQPFGGGRLLFTENGKGFVRATTTPENRTPCNPFSGVGYYLTEDGKGFVRASTTSVTVDNIIITVTYTCHLYLSPISVARY